MATPVKLAATMLKTVPVPQMHPPTRPRMCPDAGPRKNPLKLTGSPTSGCFMKYTFQMKQDSNAPNVRNTTALYGPSGLPRVIECVRNGAHRPIRTPETTQVITLFLETVRPEIGRFP